MLCVGAASIFTESAAIASVSIGNSARSNDTGRKENDSNGTDNSNRLSFAEQGARPKRSSLKNWPPQEMRQFEKPIDLFPNDNDTGDEFEDEDEDMILASLQNRNKLMLTKVDEKVRRVKSMPRCVKRVDFNPRIRSRPASVRHDRSLEYEDEDSVPWLAEESVPGRSKSASLRTTRRPRSEVSFGSTAFISQKPPPSSLSSSALANEGKHSLIHQTLKEESLDVEEDIVEPAPIKQSSSIVAKETDVKKEIG